jgi:hypothetical protein
MRCELKSARSGYTYIGKWLAVIFVRGIGRQMIEEVAIISKDTKGARYVASSLSGRELDALVVKCR